MGYQFKINFHDSQLTPQHEIYLLELLLLVAFFFTYSFFLSSCAQILLGRYSKLLKAP